MKDKNLIEKIDDKINYYLKLKYFTLYLVFSSLIFIIMDKTFTAFSLMITAFIYLYLMNKSKIVI